MAGRREYIAVFLCTLSVSAVGVTFTWLEPLVDRLVSEDSEIPMTRDQSSWLVASIELGEILFTVPSGLLADWLGRKWTLYTVGPITLVSWVLVVCSRNMFVLYVVRFLQGVNLGTVFAVAPMYIAEVASPQVRGRLSGHFQTMWAAGILYSYIAGPYLSYNMYALVCAMLPLVFTVLFVFCPESPYYLVMKGRGEEARAALEWLRDCDVEEELQDVKMSVEKDASTKAHWYDLIATSKDRRVFFTVQLICFVKYMIGSPAINSYAASTFAAASGGTIDEHLMTILLGVILLVSALCGSALSDLVGRRPLLIGSTLANAVLHIVSALYFFLDGTSSYAWIMHIAVAGTCVVTNLGLGSLLQTVQAELFSSRTRALGSGVTGITAAIATFLDLKQYQTVNDIFGLYMNFVIFAAFAIVGAVIMFFVITETKGKTLGEIQQAQIKKKNIATIDMDRRQNISTIP